MKAPDLLQKAADIMIERGKQYDKPEGERSMGAAVRAFNAITGRELTEPEGWLLLQVLKDVRQWQNPGRYHADSAEDCIAYAALKAEALAGMDGHDDLWKDAPESAQYILTTWPQWTGAKYYIGKREYASDKGDLTNNVYRLDASGLAESGWVIIAERGVRP